MSRGKIALLTIFLVLLADQVLKILIKTHMMLGQEIRIADWFIIHFTENNGMAFGMELGGSIGKMILSLFRVVAVIAIGIYVVYLIKQKSSTGLIVSMSLILAGALGNIVDSLFYGMIFTDSYYQVAQAFPSSGGYSSFLHGKVVDMFYFPLFSGHFPSWLPIWGGEEFEFFRPVFNIADSAITVGVAIILIFQKKYFKD